MKWLEIISLRCPGNIGTQVSELLRELHESGSGIDTTKRLAEIKVYHHSTVETDLSIHIHWESESSGQNKSPLGLRIYSSLRNLGLSNHSVWVETAALKFRLGT